MNNFIVRSVMKVASGTAFAQIIALLLIPFITKVYGAESYGIMGVYLSTLALLTSIVALTLPRAIVLPEKREEAQAITAVSFKIIISMTILSFIILIFTKNKIMTLLGIETIGNWILLVPIAAFFLVFFKLRSSGQLEKINLEYSRKQQYINLYIIMEEKF